MMNDKKIEESRLNDTELERVSGGISDNNCGVDEKAARRPKEELAKNKKVALKRPNATI